MKRTTAIATLFMLVFLSVAPGLTPVARAVEPENVISYQGRLLNTAGVPVSDATADMEFYLYDQSTDTCLWSNDDSACATTDTVTIDLADGLFTVNLGDGADTATIPSSVFADYEDVYLEVVVNGETLTPRKQITAAAYAVNSQTLDGLDSTDFLQNTGGIATGNYDFTGAVFDGASPLVFDGATPGGDMTTITVTDPTAANAIIFQDGSGTVAFLSDIATPDLDTVYTNDADKIMQIDDPLGLTFQTTVASNIFFDLQSSGDFTVQTSDGEISLEANGVALGDLSISADDRVDIFAVNVLDFDGGTILFENTLTLENTETIDNATNGDITFTGHGGTDHDLRFNLTNVVGIPVIDSPTRASIAVTDNLLVGATSVSGVNAGFVLSGDDIYAEGDIAAQDSMYADSFVAGDASTTYGDGFITDDNADGDDIFEVTLADANQIFRILGGNLHVGGGTPDIATTGHDVYIQGFLEMDNLIDVERNENAQFIRLVDHTNTDSVGLYAGGDNPKGVVTAEAGSLYLGETGSAWINLDGAADWTAVMTEEDYAALDFDEVYNNDGDKALDVNDVSGLSFNSSVAGNIVFDLQSTGDFVVENSGSPFFTLSDSGAITGSATAASQLSTSTGTLTLSTTAGGTASSLIIASDDTSLDAINIDSQGGIDIDSYGTGFDGDIDIMADSSGIYLTTNDAADGTIYLDAAEDLWIVAQNDWMQIFANGGGIDMEAVEEISMMAGGDGISMGNFTPANTILTLTGGNFTDGVSQALYIDTNETSATDDLVLIQSNVGGANNNVFRIEGDGEAFSDVGFTAGAFSTNYYDGSIDSSSGTFDIIDSATGTQTIHIGGVTSDRVNTISIATNNTSQDRLFIGNNNTSTTIDITGGDDWSIGGTGAAIFDSVSIDNGVTNINLEGTGSATTSGAYVIGTFDEFARSNGANVQDVLDDLDADLNTAYGWGDHSLAGYLTVESDPVWTAAEPSYGNLGQAETITGNWVNTANPWLDNEVTDALTISAAGSVDAGALIFITTDGAGATSSDSGLETDGNQFGLLQGCANGEVLAWDDVAAAWECYTLAGGHVQNTDTGTTSATWLINTGGNQATLNTSGLSGNQNFVFPNASGTLALTSDLAGYLTDESDPVYSGSSWFTTTNNSANWDTAYSWGDWSLQGFLTSETDPVWVAAESNYGNLGQAETISANWVNTANPWAANEIVSTVMVEGENISLLNNNAGYLTDESDPVYSGSSWFTTTNNSTDWDAAYGWGDHSLAGYLTSIAIDSLDYIDFEDDMDLDATTNVDFGAYSYEFDLDGTGDFLITDSGDGSNTLTILDNGQMTLTPFYNTAGWGEAALEIDASGADEGTGVAVNADSLTTGIGFSVSSDSADYYSALLMNVALTPTITTESAIVSPVAYFSLSPGVNAPGETLELDGAAVEIRDDSYVTAGNLISYDNVLKVGQYSQLIGDTDILGSVASFVRQPYMANIGGTLSLYGPVVEIIDQPSSDEGGDSIVTEGNVLKIQQWNANATGNVVDVFSFGAGNGVFINQQGEGVALNIFQDQVTSDLINALADNETFEGNMLKFSTNAASADINYLEFVNDADATADNVFRVNGLGEAFSDVGFTAGAFSTNYYDGEIQTSADMLLDINGGDLTFDQDTTIGDGADALTMDATRMNFVAGSGATDGFYFDGTSGGDWGFYYEGVGDGGVVFDTDGYIAMYTDLGNGVEIASDDYLYLSANGLTEFDFDSTWQVYGGLDVLIGATTDMFLSSGDNVWIDAGSGDGLYLNGGNGGTRYTHIGDGTTTSIITIATNNAQADTVTVGNTNAATTVAITGGDDWSVSVAGAAIFDSVSIEKAAVNIDLEGTGSATTSGAYVIGTFDEFAYSNGANVQDVLDDLDAAIATALGIDLQDAYDNGTGAINTSTGKNIAFTLDDEVADTSFVLTQAATSAMDAMVLANSVGTGVGIFLNQDAGNTQNGAKGNQALYIDTDDSVEGNDLFGIESDFSSGDNLVFRIEADGEAFSDVGFTAGAFSTNYYDGEIQTTGDMLLDIDGGYLNLDQDTTVAGAGALAIQPGSGDNLTLGGTGTGTTVEFTAGDGVDDGFYFNATNGPDYGLWYEGVDDGGIWLWTDGYYELIADYGIDMETSAASITAYAYGGSLDLWGEVNVDLEADTGFMTLQSDQELSIMSNNSYVDINAETDIDIEAFDVASVWGETSVDIQVTAAPGRYVTNIGNGTSGSDTYIGNINGGTYDTVTIGNANASSTVAITGGDDWSVSVAGAAIFDSVSIEKAAVNIDLEGTGSATTSGAYVIGTFDEFAYSNGANVQDVLDDLDAAIAGVDLQDAYDNGAGTITTTTGKNIGFTLADLAADTSFVLTQAATSAMDALVLANSVGTGVGIFLNQDAGNTQNGAKGNQALYIDTDDSVEGNDLFGIESDYSSGDNYVFRIEADGEAFSDVGFTAGAFSTNYYDGEIQTSADMLLDIDGGNLNLDQDTTVASAGSLTILSGAASILTLDSDTTGSIYLGTGAGAKYIGMGNYETGTTMTFQAGDGTYDGFAFTTPTGNQFVLNNDPDGEVLLQAINEVYLNSAWMHLNGSSLVSIDTGSGGTIGIGGVDPTTTTSITGGDDWSIATTGRFTTNEDIYVNGGDINSTAGVLGISDHSSSSTLTIEIGGVRVDRGNTINIATNGTTADAISIGNTNAATTVAITGGNDWSIDAAGLITTAGDIAVNGDDITSDHDLTVNPAGGQLYLADTRTFNVGGVQNLAYNAISNIGGSAGGGAVTDDNDLYVQGALEIDGAADIAGTLTVADITCTDCLDFTEFEDALDLDTSTSIGASNANTLSVVSDLASGNRTNDLFVLSQPNQVNSMTGDMMEIRQYDTSSTGRGLYIDQQGLGVALQVDSDAITNNVMTISSQSLTSGDALVIDVGDQTDDSGYALYIHSLETTATADIVRIDTNVGVDPVFRIEGDGEAFSDIGFTAGATTNYYDGSIISSLAFTYAAPTSYTWQDNAANTLMTLTDSGTTGTLNVTGDITCTDCLDFTDFANSMSLDESTSITAGDALSLSILNNSSANTIINLQSTGDFEVQNNGTPFLTLSDTGAITGSATAQSQLSTSTGTLTLSTTAGGAANSLIISSNDTSADAIDINTTGAGGGIDVDLTNGGFTLDAGGAINGDITLTSADTFIIDANDTDAFAFLVDAEGGISMDAALPAVSNAMNITTSGANSGMLMQTTDGGIILRAQGAANGDLGLNAGDDMTITAVGDITLNSAGSVYLATDDDLMPTLGAGDADIGAVGTRWDNIYGVAGNFSGTVTMNDITCTDCLDFTEFEDALDLDASTSITMDSNETFSIINGSTANAIVNLTSTGDFVVQDNGSPFFTLSDAGAITGAATATSQLSTSTGTLTLSTTAGGAANSLILSSNDTSGDAVDINATGTGGGIDVDTADGGITMDAGGAVNGDITLSSGDDMYFTSTGEITLDSANTVYINDDIILENGEKIDNATNNYITFTGAGGTDHDLRFGLTGGTMPTIESPMRADIAILDSLSIGATSETLDNAGFGLAGSDDLFVAGMAGIEGNIYTDGALVVGATTTYGNGYITDTDSAADDLFDFNLAAAADSFRILTGNLRVGNGSPGIALNGEDAYIEGTLEVDSTAQFDGNVVVADLTCTDCLDFTEFADNQTLDNHWNVTVPYNNAIGFSTTPSGGARSFQMMELRQNNDDTYAGHEVLRVASYDTDTIQPALIVANSSQGAAIEIQQSGDTSGALYVLNTGNSGAGIYLYSNNNADAGNSLAYFQADNAAFDEEVLTVVQDGTGTALDIDKNGTTGVALNINSEATTSDVMTINGSSLTSGEALHIITGDQTDDSGYALYIDSGETSAAADVVRIDTNVGADPVFRIEADGEAFSDVGFTAGGASTNYYDGEIQTSSDMLLDIDGGDLVFDQDTTIGDGGDALAIDTSDWDISVTGIMNGIGNINSNGDITATGGDFIGAALDRLDIGEVADAQFTFQRNDAGVVTISSADNDANAALTVSAGGSGALTLGDAGSTTAITSSDWAIDATGVMTGIGGITSDGTVSATDFTCTDCLDFTELDDTLDLDASTSIVMTDAQVFTISNGSTGNVLVNLTSTGDFVVQDNGSPVMSFNDNGTVSFTPTSASGLGFYVLAPTTDGNVFDISANSLTSGSVYNARSSSAFSGSLAQMDSSGASTGDLLRLQSTNASATSRAIFIDLDNGNNDNDVFVLQTDETTKSGTGVDTTKARITASGEFYSDVGFTAGGASTNYKDGEIQTSSDMLLDIDGGDLVFDQDTTIGDGGDALAIDTSDWDISVTGIMNGIGNINSNGDITATGGDFVGAASDRLDIGEAADAQFTFIRNDAGTVTLTSGDDDINAALTLSAGGSGALTLGDAGSTTTITSSDWAIDATGVMTGIGAFTNDGRIRQNMTASTDNFGSDGSSFMQEAVTLTTPGGGPAAAAHSFNAFAQPTLAAGVAQTVTNAATVLIGGAPIAGANMTITNPYALYVNDGTVKVNDTLEAGDITCTDCLDFTEFADNLAFDGATSINGEAGETLMVTRTLTDATAETGMTFVVTASDTTSATTTQRGMMIANASSTEGLDVLLRLHNGDVDDSVGIGLEIDSVSGTILKGIDMASTNIVTDLSLQNRETIDNNTDGEIVFVGVGGGDNTNLRLDLDGTMPVFSSIADASIGILENLLVGSTTVSGVNAAFTLTGDDIYAEGHIAAQDNMYADAFVAGDSSTIYGSASLVTSATAFNFDVGNTGVLSFRDGTNTLMTLTDNGTAGTLAVTGATSIDQNANATAFSIDAENTDTAGAQMNFDALTTGTGITMTLANASTSADGIRITDTGSYSADALITGSALDISRDLSQTSGTVSTSGSVVSISSNVSSGTISDLAPVVTINQLNASSVGHSLYLTNVGTGAGLAMVHNGTGPGLNIQTNSTGNTIYLDTNGNSSSIFVDSESTTARAMVIDSTSTNANAIDFAITGTGGGMRFETTDGGIALTANGSANGDIALSADDALRLVGLSAGTAVTIDATATVGADILIDNYNAIANTTGTLTMESGSGGVNMTTQNNGDITVTAANVLTLEGTATSSNGVVLSSDGASASSIWFDAYDASTDPNGGIYGTTGTGGIDFDIIGAGSINLDILGTDTAGWAVCHSSTRDDQTDVDIIDCLNAPVADYQEMYPVAADVTAGYLVASGATDVVTNDGDTMKQMVRTTDAYQMNMIGIASDPEDSGDFNSIGYNIADSDNPYPVAMVGRVMTKVSDENGPISAGDLITSSSTAGVGMKATQAGQVIGYAIADYAGPGEGEVMVFVSPQYYVGNVIGTDGTGTVVSDTLVLNSLGTATAVNPAYDSETLALRGSAWNGSAAEGVEMKLVTDVASTSDYHLSIKNTADTEVAYVTDEGTMAVSGDMIVTGKLYPSDRGVKQTSFYIYFDSSLGAGLEYMRTNAAGWSTGSYDFAEMFPSDDSLEAGDLVVFASEPEHVRRSTAAYDTMIAGIVSTRPGFLAGEANPNDVPVALAGRVPTRVSLENGSIAVGDPLTTSSTPGAAMKATESGFVVGYALEPYDGSQGDNLVITYVNVGYFGGTTTDALAGTDNAASQTPAMGSNLTTLDMDGDIYMHANRIVDVGELRGVSGTWSIDGEGTIRTRSLVKTVIESYSGEEVETAAVTSPEVVITLTGTATLTGGSATVRFEDIAPTFNDVTSTVAPIRVFVTPNGPVSLYVTEKSNDGFTVQELGGASDGVTFDWMVSAYRKDYEPAAALVIDVPVEEPVAEEPAVEEPVTEEPAVEEPVVEEPVVEEPVIEEPAVEEPVVEEPVVEEPVAEEPVVEEPVIEEPVVEEPVAEEPVV